MRYPFGERARAYQLSFMEPQPAKPRARRAEPVDGLRLKGWLAQHPAVWAGWPSTVSGFTGEECEQLMHRLHAAGCPHVGSRIVAQASVAIAALRDERRSAYRRQVAETECVL